MAAVRRVAGAVLVGALGMTLAAVEVLHACFWTLGWRQQDGDGDLSRRRRVVIVDGYCALCAGFVRFVSGRLARKGSVQFVSSQGDSEFVGDLSREFGFDVDRLANCIACVSDADGGVLWGPQAVATVLGWCLPPYPAVGFAIRRLVPRLVSDKAYDLVASNRYAFFGKIALRGKGD